MSDDGVRPVVPAPAANNHSLYAGFEGYLSASDDDYRHVLTEGLVVADTNVLLNLYRYNLQTRTDLLSALGRLGDRLWMPNQVLREFWRNREGAVRDPEDAAEKAMEALQNLSDAAVQALRTWTNRVALDPTRRDVLQVAIRTGFNGALDAIRNSVEPKATSEALDTNTDSVLRMLDEAFKGRVAAPWTADERAAAVLVGLQRAEASIPPGYLDAKAKADDPERAVGDYLVWEEVVREAGRRKCDVLIVTGDVKEDWWRQNKQGETRGPRVELVAEMRERAGVRLFMLRPESFLVLARRILNVEIQEESLKDVERVDRIVAGVDTGGWTRAALDELLDRLDVEGPVQAAAIRRAAQHGGMVDRDEVYDLGDYEDTRTLRGFTRPAKRIAQEMRDRGVIPPDAVDILDAVYDPGSNWTVAVGFRTPAQVAALLRADAEGS